MTPWQIKEAAEALEALKRLEDQHKLLERSEMRVASVVLTRGEGGGGLHSDITLTKFGGSSRGIEGIGFPDGLRDVMTAALLNWSRQRVAEAKAKAIAAGVVFDDGETQAIEEPVAVDVGITHGEGT